MGSSWSAKEKGQRDGMEADYLSDLGAKQLYNINVDHGTKADGHGCGCTVHVQVKDLLVGLHA
jgi:hypothetical protein